MSMGVRHFWQDKPWLFLSFAMVLWAMLLHVTMWVAKSAQDIHSMEVGA